jgi:hypothetical protein
MKKITMPVIAMLLATACQTPSFAEDPVSRVDTYKEPAQKLRCVATCNSNPDPHTHQRVKKHGIATTACTLDIVGDIATTMEQR